MVYPKSGNQLTVAFILHCGYNPATKKHPTTRRFVGCLAYVMHRARRQVLNLFSFPREMLDPFAASHPQEYRQALENLVGLYAKDD